MTDTPTVWKKCVPCLGDFAVFGGIWSVYAFLVWKFWFVCDDAFISFRFARNLALGHGLRYNLGDGVPVEGYSNFLWTVTCAVVQWLGADPRTVMPAISFACGTILLVLLYHALRTRFEANMTVAAIGTMLAAFLAPFAVWSTGGLETMAFSLFLFVTFLALCSRVGTVQIVAAGVCGLALSLLRVEGIFWVGLLGAVTLLRGHRVRGVVLYASIVLGGWLIWYFWRYSYYELPLPNTLYVKVGLTGSTVGRGAWYVLHHLATFITPMLLIPAYVHVFRRKRRDALLGAAIVSLCVFGYAILVGGDFMAMSRFLVPGIAFNAILYANLLKRISERLGTQTVAVLLGLLLIVLCSLPGFGVHLVPQSVRAKFNHRYGRTYQSELERWAQQRQNTLKWTQQGRALREYTEPGDTVALVAIGAIGYYSELFIFDRAGLVTREVATLGVQGGLGRPGHDKLVDASFFLPRKPTILFQFMLEFRSRDQFREGIEQRVQTFSERFKSDRYAPDLMPAGQIRPDTPQLFLVVWKRLDDGASRATAFRRFERKLADVIRENE